METGRLRAGDNIIRSFFYITGGAKSERLIFHKLAKKGLPKKFTVLFFFTFYGLVDGPVYST